MKSNSIINWNWLGGVFYIGMLVLGVGGCLLIASDY